jgi:hypothetical protein
MNLTKYSLKGSGGLVVKVSASHPRAHWFEPYSGHNHVSSYETSTGWFQEPDSKVITISCKNLFRIRAKINIFKYSLVKYFLHQQ